MRGPRARLSVLFCGRFVGCAELCVLVCVACVRRCACSCRGWAGRHARVRGLCCMLRWSVRCAMRGLLACAVLGDTRHVADMSLCWVGLVASCASARTCVWSDGVGERGAGRHARKVRVGPARMCVTAQRCVGLC